ncbi:MAG: class I SAM-dependent methyltransferase [Planctomycetaceae bacterium]
MSLAVQSKPAPPVIAPVETSSASFAVSEERPGACLLCGSSGDKIVAEENGYVGRHCKCGVVYVDPWPGEEGLAATHDFHVETYYAFPAKLRFRFIERMFKKLLGRKGNLLEVGPGPGFTLKMARDAGYDVQSIEPNATCAERVEAMGIPNERSMVEETQLGPVQFDAVFHVDLMSHFADPVRSLKAMKRLLKPDGFLCFEAAAFGGLSDQWYQWIGEVGYPQHPWIYSWDALCELFDRAGLEVVHRDKFNLFPGTVLSTIGNSVFSRFFPKPKSRSGKPASPNAIYRWYGYMQYLLRYRVGRFVPSMGGPSCSLIALRPKA